MTPKNSVKMRVFKCEISNCDGRPSGNIPCCASNGNQLGVIVINRTFQFYREHGLSFRRSLFSYFSFIV